MRPPAMEQRLPYNPGVARKLLTDASYPNGFEAGFNCPNDRYANDAEICQAVAANMARVGIRLRVQTEAVELRRIQPRDTVRNSLIAEALALHAEDVGHVPLHQQMVTWGMKSHITAYQRADGFMLFKWVSVGQR